MSWASLASNELVTFTEMQDAVNTDVFLRRASFSSTSECVTKADAASYLFIDTGYGPYAGLASNEEITKAALTQAGCIQIQITGIYIGTSGLNIECFISEALPAAVYLSFDFCTDNGATGSITFSFSSGALGSQQTSTFDVNTTSGISGGLAAGTYSGNVIAGAGTLNQLFVKPATLSFSTSDTTRCYQATGTDFDNGCSSAGGATICLNCG